MANTFQPKTDNSVTAPRSRKNLSFNWLGSADFGRIIPFHWQELLETDKIVTCKPLIELQMLPLASPTFGEMSIYCHYFFVPFRQIWENFTDFHSQTGVGAHSSIPFWTRRDFQQFYGNLPSDGEKRAIFKHFTSLGLPPFFTNDIGATAVSANDRLYTLPLRAYDKIWWDFYRDPEVLPDADFNLYNRTGSGRESLVSSSLAFWPKRRNIKDVWWSELFATNGTLINSAGFDIASLSQNPALVQQVDSERSINLTLSTQGRNVRTAAGSSAVSTSVIAQSDSENLRKLEALTRMAERLSLSGKRSIDRLFAQYGVIPDFERMKLCEYVGGAKATVLVSDITASATTSSNPGSEGSVLGQKGGAGYATLSNMNIKYTCREPGILMGVISIMPKLHFVQGISKKWYRQNLDDFFRKELQHVGQVAVAKSEIATSYTANDNDHVYDNGKDGETFAFAAPYYEYGYNHDVLAGDFMFYHNTEMAGPYQQDLSYMQSMGMYADFPTDRTFNAENLQLRNADCNQIFYYLGGEIWENVDDHFHVNINVKCFADRPIDGAAPTLETDDQPHASSAPIKQSTEL